MSKTNYNKIWYTTSVTTAVLPFLHSPMTSFWKRNSANVIIPKNGNDYIKAYIFAIRIYFNNDTTRYVADLSRSDETSNSDTSLPTTALVHKLITEKLTECDEKYALKGETGNASPEIISNSMLIIQRNEWMDYFNEPEQVPAGYEYQGCKTDWFPIIDYSASTMTDMLT